VDRLASFSFDRVVGIRLGDEFLPAQGRPNAKVSLSEPASLMLKFLSSSRFLTHLTPIAREVLIAGDGLLKLCYSPGGEFPLSFGFVPADSFDYEHEADDVSKVVFYRESYSFQVAGEALKLHTEDHFPSESLIYDDEIKPMRKGLRLYPSLDIQLPTFGGAREKRYRKIPNPFTFLPFVHVANRRPFGEKFGVSELKDVTVLIDDINFKISQRSRNISRTMNAILKNVNGRIIHDRLDDTQVITVLGDNAQLEYLTNDSGFEGADKHIQDLKQTLTELTGTVMLSPEKLTSIGALSGFALSILYEPLLNAANSKRAEIGSKIEQFLKLVLLAFADIGLVTPNQVEHLHPSLVYGPDLQFTEDEKLTRLKRLQMAKEMGLDGENDPTTLEA